MKLFVFYLIRGIFCVWGMDVGLFVLSLGNFIDAISTVDPHCGGETHDYI